MNSVPVGETDILIVGAGPTGLVLALWLTRLGVRVRLIDKTEGAGTTSRAVAVQARTLELYDQIGLAGTVVGAGRQVLAANLWVAGKKAARIVFGNMGIGLSPFPYALIYPQDEHERLIIEQLARVGVEVERSTELLDFEESEGGVLAHLSRPDGASQMCKATYLAGCDGAHSRVREVLKIGFAGGAYDRLFYVADVDASGVAVNGEVQVALDKSDFLAVFPLKSEARARLVGTIRDGASRRGESLRWGDVSSRVIEWMNIDVQHVNWFSTYRVHHRVADRFSKGRAFILGDAAHIHSPVGGQGMNTGIGDAINLAWKFAAVLSQRAPATLLETYEPERIAFARRLVATTDRVFTGVTSGTLIARWLRLRVAPVMIPFFFKFKMARRFMFRTLSQTSVNYRNSSLSQGHAGPVHGGDRLPWSRANSPDGSDNFKPLTSLDWQVHLYGIATPEIQKMCSQRRLSLHVFDWRADTAEVSLVRDALYLVRPDGYVALADPLARAATLASYLDARGLRPGIVSQNTSAPDARAQ